MPFDMEIPMYDTFRPFFIILYFGGLIAMTATMLHSQHVMKRLDKTLPAALPDENRFTFASWGVGVSAIALQIGYLLTLGMIWLLAELTFSAWIVLFVVGMMIPTMVNVERELGEKGIKEYGVPFVSVR
jgi:hypothetical protein